MSPDTLLKIKEQLTKKSSPAIKILTPPKIEKFLTLLKLYHEKDIIYPGVLIRKLNIKMKEAYQLLEFLESQNIVARNFEVYCSKCQKYTGAVYETLKEIPDDLICDDCGNELDPFENTIIVYKVLID